MPAAGTAASSTPAARSGPASGACASAMINLRSFRSVRAKVLRPRGACYGSGMDQTPCSGLTRVGTLDDLVERDQDHDCAGFGVHHICVRVAAVADLTSPVR